MNWIAEEAEVKKQYVIDIAKQQSKKGSANQYIIVWSRKEGAWFLR